MTAPVSTTLYMRPDRNLALELVRVTEAGAMAAGRWVGRGDKEGGDGAAVDAMRQLVSSVSMRGVVVIGEGEKDEAPMLYNGEEVGNGLGPDCDFAVDPVDGTTLMAKGMPNAISVLAVAERGAMFDPSAVFYMDKIAVGPDAADAIDITAPVAENLRKVAKAKKSAVSDLTVCILDRPRHAELIAQVRAAGARIRLISDGDVAGAIAAARPESGTDMLIGTGGTPEGIIAAAAMRCMGGVLQARLAPTDDLERQKAIDAGHDLDRILSTEDLVSGENVFFTATGITDGDLLRGVRFSCRRRAHPVDRDALQVGHRAGHRGLPPPRQTPRIRQHRLHRRRQRTSTDAINPHRASSTRPAQYPARRLISWGIRVEPGVGVVDGGGSQSSDASPGREACRPLSVSRRCRAASWGPSRTRSCHPKVWTGCRPRWSDGEAHRRAR